MESDYLKDKKEFVSVALLVVSAFLGVLVLVNVADFFVSSARAEQLVADAVAQGKLDPNGTEKYFAESREIADELKKKNLFAPPPPPKKHPVKQVAAILGDEVLISGKWYKLGDKIGDAKIVAIEPTCVRIEWQGKEKVFAPMKSVSAPEPGKKEKKAVVKETKGKEKASATEKPTEEKVGATSEDPLAWMGVKLSPSVRAKLLEKWNEMSDEEKEQMKEQWNNMSDEEKQQAVKAWEEHL